MSTQATTKKSQRKENRALVRCATRHMRMIYLVEASHKTVVMILRLIAERHGQKHIAKMLGVSIAHVSDILRGNRVISERLMGKIASLGGAA